MNGRSGRRYGTPESSRAFGMAGQSGPNLHYAMGLDTGAKSYAAEMQAYLRRYGVTSEDLGRYVVSARAYAATNPRAMYHGRPLTLEEHQASRWIVEPWLRRYDCCLETDGGAALVVTTLDRARDLRNRPVHVRAATQGLGIGARIAYDVYRSPEEVAAEKAAIRAELERQSGIAANRVDVAMLYDAFSPGVFKALEDYGFCEPGGAKALIRAGGTAPDRAIPVNPNGGLLGEAYMHGVNNIIEAVRQLRGSAANQIEGAETALVAGGGALILARD
jgi:acetyl-CoA acetyltransferase